MYTALFLCHLRAWGGGLQNKVYKTRSTKQGLLNKVYKISFTKAHKTSFTKQGLQNKVYNNKRY